jgi:hypothetical protein
MIQAFFAALAIPLTTAVLLMVALWVSGPRAPLVALLVNAFVLFEVAGCSRAVRLPMPAGYFRRSRFERRWIYELLGIRVFKRLMRSRAYRGINPDFRLSRGRSGFADLAQTMEAAEAAHDSGLRHRQHTGGCRPAAALARRGGLAHVIQRAAQRVSRHVAALQPPSSRSAPENPLSGSERPPCTD